MKARLVTAYVPIPGHPRTATEYGALGEKLSGVPVPKKAFYNNIADLWMTKYISCLPFTPRPSTGDNPAKNSLAYHYVNHEKSTWLARAAREDTESDVFVWVDYGIFNLPGVNNQAITEFMSRVDDRAIYAPGCVPAPVAVESAYPCWRFCGSVIAVPRKMVEQFDFLCRCTARKHVSSTKNVDWEVNTWARVEAQHKLPIRWYQANHDVSLFTGLELS